MKTISRSRVLFFPPEFKRAPWLLISKFRVMRRTRREGDLKLIGEWRWQRRREGERGWGERGINCESPRTDRKEGEGGWGRRAPRCYIAPRRVFWIKSLSCAPFTLLLDFALESCTRGGRGREEGGWEDGLILRKLCTRSTKFNSIPSNNLPTTCPDNCARKLPFVYHYRLCITPIR